MHKLITATFEHVANADTALSRLEEIGLSEEDVSIITQSRSVNIANDAVEGITKAATTGGLIGGVVGLLTGLGVLAIPGIGSLFIAGPIVLALGLTGTVATTATGALTGILAGGLIGAFKELGIDEVRAKVLEERVKEGDVLLMVYPASEEMEEVEELLGAAGGRHIYRVDMKH